MEQVFILFSLFCLIIISGSVSATVLNSLRKWGILEWYELYREYLHPKMPHSVCEFCFLFWSSVILVGAYSFFSEFNYLYLVAPFGAASIGLAIYKACVK